MKAYQRNLTNVLKPLGLVISAALLFSLGGCSSDGDGNGISETCNVPQEAFLTTQTRIGGAVSNVQVWTDATDPEAPVEWSFYNLANELRATPVGSVKGLEYALEVAGFIRDIRLIEREGKRYALLAMGEEGIAAVDVSDPMNMTLVASAKVGYFQDGLIWTEGGGDIIGDDEEPNSIASSRAPISSLAVFDDGDIDNDANTPAIHLLIGDEGYGLHKTALNNLFDTVNGRNENGTLRIDQEVYTLQYAGENPWGGPKSLTLFGTGAGQKLFVAQGFLGMGIYDPVTLQQVGHYNLYTDTSNANGGEDWFINMNVADEVQTPTATYLDACTGMPNYAQASFEIQQVWHGDVEAATPWAQFDRYGKYYYDARKVEVVTHAGDPGQTIAYIAYGLGGLLAVDVSGYETAGPRNETCSANLSEGAPFLTAGYLGYVPAVPAHGPDEQTGAQSQSLFPYFGVGMLKEAGIVDVKVDAVNNHVYFSDHFAGLMVIGNADNPSVWAGADAPYDNDTIGVLGDHWPDYEFVTSYDMTPYVPAGSEEEVPAFISEAPILLATGEVSGHGNRFALSSGFDAAASGAVDVLLTAGGGGLSFVDVQITGVQAENSFAVPVHFATTSEIGAAADGTATEEINIGHSEGVNAYGNLLFLADGPHGMSVWQIADAVCTPTDEVHVVANTLQSEYPVTLGTETINPTPHAYDVVLDVANQSALVMSQSRGLRRVSVAQEGGVGTPLLLYPTASDIYEHNTDAGNVVNFIHMQDHTYATALKGSLAFTADGSNGLTVYDLSQDPSAGSDYVVSNLGGDTDSQPDLGHATGVALWDGGNGQSYALIAAGNRGIAVVDVSDVHNMALVKIFEPVKEEDGKYGKADGKSVTVRIVGEHAFFTYDSFGVVVYNISDLIAPLPDGVDPSDIWNPGEIGYRPLAVARFKLQDPALFGSAELAEYGGGSSGMDVVQVSGKTWVYVAYGDAGVIKIDWTQVAAPVLMQHLDTVGSALDVKVINGRTYVADGSGGLVWIK